MSKALPKTESPDEFERTMAFADIAMGQLKALKQPATPRNYEIWYTYATGYRADLNEAINSTLEKSSSLGVEEIDDIYENYLSPARFTDKLDGVGNKVMNEIEQVMAMVEASTGSASNYSQSLAGVTEQLDEKGGLDREMLRNIVEGLVSATKEMEKNNKQLEERLKKSKTEISDLQANLEAVRSESLTDPLTTLSNRKFFDQSITKMIDDASKKNEPLALLVTDIDHFKKFNDTFGHLTGDQVLRLVAMSVKNNVKGQDVAARYGGEEFCVILPNTALRAAVTVAEHIRRAVMTKELVKRSTGEHLGRITISVGVSTYRPGDNPASMIERADACLYAAKHGGRNRVVCETDPEASESVNGKKAGKTKAA